MPNIKHKIFDLLKDDFNDYTKLELIKSFDTVLSLDLLKEEIKESVLSEEEILKLIEERKLAKQNKDFNKADQIRNDLLEKGIVLKDTREGTTYEIV